MLRWVRSNIRAFFLDSRAAKPYTNLAYSKDRAARLDSPRAHSERGPGGGSPMPRSKSAARTADSKIPASSAPPTSGHHSPAALAARRANLLKARAAPRERIYRSTEKRRTASRRNLAKARAARATRRGTRRPRLNAVKHGLFTHEFSPATLRRLGEDPQKFREMQRLFRRLLSPRERPERELVRRLCETCWRRLRLFRARARQEQESLRKALEKVPCARDPLGPFETELRAQFLGIGLFDLGRTVDEGLKLHSQIECLLRTLLRKRSAGTEEFHMLSPRRDSRIAEVKSLSLEEKPLAEMTEEELTERLLYFPFGRLSELATLQAEEQEQREIAELLDLFNSNQPIPEDW